MENNKKWLIDLLKHSKNIKINIIHQSDVDWDLQINGEIVDMSEKEKSFSNKQLSQLATLIEEIIDKKVPKMINELVPPIVETIVDRKLEPIKNDINQLKQDVQRIMECPTIKRELSL